MRISWGWPDSTSLTQTRNTSSQVVLPLGFVPEACRRTLTRSISNSRNSEQLWNSPISRIWVWRPMMLSIRQQLILAILTLAALIIDNLTSELGLNESTERPSVVCLSTSNSGRVEYNPWDEVSCRSISLNLMNYTKGTSRIHFESASLQHLKPCTSKAGWSITLQTKSCYPLRWIQRTFEGREVDNETTWSRAIARRPIL